MFWGILIVGASLGTLSVTSSYLDVFPFGEPLWSGSLVSDLWLAGWLPSCLAVDSLASFMWWFVFHSLLQLILIGSYMVVAHRPTEQVLSHSSKAQVSPSITINPRTVCSLSSHFLIHFRIDDNFYFICIKINAAGRYVSVTGMVYPQKYALG